MYSKRLVSVGLAAVISLAIALPVFAQGNENKDYNSIQDERDQKKKRQMLEKFLKDYPNSQHRPQYDIDLITLYYGNKDWKLMVDHAESFGQTQANSDAKMRSNFYTLAMEAARQANNEAKYNEFADKALAADPNNMSVLMTMARGLAENPPTDAAAKAAAMTKAMGYAERASKITKSDMMTEAEWHGVQSRLHSITGTIYFNQSKWPEANTEFNEYLKTNPKDGVIQFRNGVAYYSQLQKTLVILQELNAEAQKAQKADADLGPYIDRLNARNKEFEEQRDQTIDSMAKALAIGGPFASTAEQIMNPLFKQKTGSNDGQLAYIASKRTELDALTPLPTPVVGGARGTGGPGAPGGNGLSVPPANAR